MTYFEAILYGVVQGITEYLPVSSSAHLILIPKFLGTQDPGLTFDVFLYLGTLFSTLIYFWREWLQVLRSLPWIGPKFGVAADESSPDGRINWKSMFIGTLPAVIAGALFHRSIETIFRGNVVLMITLPLGGVALYLADRFSPQVRGTDRLTLKDSLHVGLFQCLALIPGMSRSGSTMFGGRLIGLDREASARFSFLLSMPITAAAVVFSLRDWQALTNGSISAGPLLVALFCSFGAGCLAIGGLLKVIRRFGYLSFAIYRVAVGVLIWQVLGF